MSIFACSITAKKGKIVEVRIFSPSLSKWWNGSTWTSIEDNSRKTLLTPIVLNNTYEDRYVGKITLPSGGPFIIEYLDKENGSIIGEDQTSILTEERVSLLDRLERLDMNISNVVKGKIYVPVSNGTSSSSVVIRR